MRLRLSLLAVSLLLTSVVVQAQKAPSGGTGNRNAPSLPSRPSGRDIRIEIQVTDDHSRPVSDKQFMVEVGTLGSSSQRTYTDADGRASFSVRAGMTYQVTVSGYEIETTTSTFELFPDESMHRERVAVKFKRDASTGAPGGIISAATLNVPGKARDEFDKGVRKMDETRWEEAKKHFEKAIKEYPKYDWAYNNLGVVEMQLNHTDAAKEAFAKAVELNEKNADASANLAQMKIKENDFDGAKQLLKKALIVQPKDPKNLMLMSFAQFKTKEFEAALANAEKVHQGDVDRFPMAHFIAARIRDGIGDRAGAERQYQLYLKEAPDGPQASMAKEALVHPEAKN